MSDEVICSQCGGKGHDGCYVSNDPNESEASVNRKARLARLEAEGGVPSASWRAQFDDQC